MTNVAKKRNQRSLHQREADLELAGLAASGDKSARRRPLKTAQSCSFWACESPVGLGKPERLRHNLTGLWSRRFTHGDRLIYIYNDESIHILNGHSESGMTFLGP